jgi:hypothetical protein
MSIQAKLGLAICAKGNTAPKQKAERITWGAVGTKRAAKKSDMLFWPGRAGGLALFGQAARKMRGWLRKKFEEPITSDGP